MKYVLQLELPGLPKGLNGSHGHFHKAARARKTWRNAAARVAYYRRPEKPLEAVKLTCIRYTASEMDYDNLVASFKPIIDGLRDAGVISNDNKKVIEAQEYRCEKAPRKKGFIVVRVESLEGEDVQRGGEGAVSVEFPHDAVEPGNEKARDQACNSGSNLCEDGGGAGSHRVSHPNRTRAKKSAPKLTFKNSKGVNL